MANNVAWRGAIEFAGFPVNVALYNRVKSIRTESFKTIAPSGKPMNQGKPIDSGTGQSYDKDLSRKGIEVEKGVYRTLTEQQLEQISDGQKTKVAKTAQFAPLKTIALDLAINRYAVLSDDKVAGSDQAVNIMWNGLRASELAYVSQVSFRSGGMDGILVVYADRNGLWAAMLPFEDELCAVPTHDFEEDEKAAGLFDQVVRQQHKVRPFDHGAFKSEYKARRAAVIDAVLKGVEQDEPVEEKTPGENVPNLMAVLQQAVEKEAVPA